MNSTFNIVHQSQDQLLMSWLFACMSLGFLLQLVSFDTVEDVWSILFIRINNVAITL